MANAPRDTEPVQVRLERRITGPLRLEAKRRKMANIQELIRKILEDFLERKSESESTVQPPSAPDINLPALLIEAHKANTEANRIIGEANRTIAKLTDTITAMTQERKNAPAEPAGVVESTGSTASSTPVAQRGRARVITGLRQGSPA